LRDIVNNSDESRHNKVAIDTTPPVLNSFDYLIDGRRVDFIFNVTETNFDEIDYIDFNDSRPRERRLCSRLKDEICEVKKSFRSGEHHLTITVLDKAGNSVLEEISFLV